MAKQQLLQYVLAVLVFPGCGCGADVARFDALRDLPQRLLAQAVLEVVEERHDLVVLLAASASTISSLPASI